MSSGRRQSQARAYCRRASHSGSWYSDRTDVLAGQLDGWLHDASAQKSSVPVKAIIAPHAGYSYSGPTAAYAYTHLKPETIKRIFILGPSHHVYLTSCAISMAQTCETPVGNLEVDEEIRRVLFATGKFETTSRSMDEDEHSIEMHLPYIAKVVGEKKVTIVPIIVGSITTRQEQEYGRLLAPYLDDPDNFFVISSDFCHWGKRFRYQPYEGEKGDISQYIEWLDHEGMKLIESQDTEGFSAYLEKHHNTICGRHPIAVLMQAVRASNSKFQIQFVRYAQSSRCKKQEDSSVSYASAIAALST